MSENIKYPKIFDVLMHSFLLGRCLEKNGNKKTNKMLVNFVVFTTVTYESQRKMMILFWMTWQNQMLYVGF